MSYSVGQAARLSHVTVRTLHHYDEIGLLRPSARTCAGYRSYSDADLERLQRILLYRELDFSLEQTAVILDDHRSDPLAQLGKQRDLLAARIEHLQRMLASVEKMMEVRSMGINLDPKEMFDVFGDFDPTEHAEEAEQRWGGSDAYEESQRRTATYTKEDWLRLKAEEQQIRQRFATAYAEGQLADDPAVTGVAEAHRQYLTRWFYVCGYPMHRGLGDMYVADPRFAANYDSLAPGLAQYIRDAIHANADQRDR